jgi:CubicO group peptidase (beta-lactamase class C family)
MTALTLQEPESETVDHEPLASVELLFREQLSPSRLFPGAALAVYSGDQLVLDLTGGYADTQTGDVVDRHTLFPMFSGSKPLAAVALWQHVERGRIALDDRVADHWPAFGQNGKNDVLVRHVLSHQGGFPKTPDELPPESWGDWDHVMAVLERMPLEYAAGTVSAYHFLTQHWVIAELVQRLDGRPFATYLREEITGPLGLVNTLLSLPPDLERRCVKLHATDGTDEWSLEILRLMHRSPIYRVVVPGASIVSTASDMARFYAAIAAGGAIDGMRILGAETIDRMLEIEVDGSLDPSFDLPVRRAFGFEIGGLDEPRRHWPGATSSVTTFWHGGMGSSVCWADRDTGLSMAFLSNGIRRDPDGAIARRDLSDAVRAAICSDLHLAPTPEDATQPL